MKKKNIWLASGLGIVLAAAGGTALAGNSTRVSTACINPNLHVLTLVTTVSVDCAPNGNDEYSTPMVTNNTGAVIPKGTQIYWADKYSNGSVGPKGHSDILSDLKPGQTQLVGAPLQGNGFTCTAVFFELK